MGWFARLEGYYDVDEDGEKLPPLTPREEEELKKAVHNYAASHMETLKRLGTIDLDIYRASIYVTARPRNAAKDSAKECE